MRQLKGRFLGLRIARTEQVHEALIPVILGQVVTRTEAHRAERRLVEEYGEDAPGPEPLRLQPDPAVLGRLKYEDFHPLGIGRKKALLIIEVSRRAARLAEITTMDSAGADQRLRAIPGIGPWSSALVISESVWGIPTPSRLAIITCQTPWRGPWRARREPPIAACSSSSSHIGRIGIGRP